MFQFDSNLSFYIPVVFPKYANKDFIKEAFEDAHIGLVRRVDLERNAKTTNYKAYVYFDWVENDMSRGIQKQILGKHKQTFFTFNNKIRNGYWIVKKNNDVLSYNELHRRYTNQRNTIAHFIKQIDVRDEVIDDRTQALQRKEKQLIMLDAQLHEKARELSQKENELQEKDDEIKRNNEKIDALTAENENDIEFFETKIVELNKRIEDLENYYCNNYISSDASEADTSEADDDDDEDKEIDYPSTEEDEEASEADDAEGTDDEEADEEADDAEGTDDEEASEADEEEQQYEYTYDDVKKQFDEYKKLRQQQRETESSDEEASDAEAEGTAEGNVEAEVTVEDEVTVEEARDEEYEKEKEKDNNEKEKVEEETKNEDYEYENDVYTDDDFMIL